MTRLEEVLEVKEKIRKLNKYFGNFSKEQTKELEQLENRLKELQSSCWHYFETVVIFTNIKSICCRCDLEQ